MFFEGDRNGTATGPGIDISITPGGELGGELMPMISCVSPLETRNYMGILVAKVQKAWEEIIRRYVLMLHLDPSPESGQPARRAGQREMSLFAQPPVGHAWQRGAWY